MLHFFVLFCILINDPLIMSQVRILLELQVTHKQTNVFFLELERCLELILFGVFLRHILEAPEI